MEDECAVYVVCRRTEVRGGWKGCCLADGVSGGVVDFRDGARIDREAGERAVAGDFDGVVHDAGVAAVPGEGGLEFSLQNGAFHRGFEITEGAAAAGAAAAGGGDVEAEAGIVVGGAEMGGGGADADDGAWRGDLRWRGRHISSGIGTGIRIGGSFGFISGGFGGFGVVEGMMRVSISGGTR